jgi:hypothetical protein
MPVDLPQALGDKVVDFPESSYGANRVTLVLADGRRISNVTVAWGREIIRVGSRDIVDSRALGFRLEDLVDVESEV